EATAQQAAERAGVRLRVADMPAEADTLTEFAKRAVIGIPAEQMVDTEESGRHIPSEATMLFAERTEPGTGTAPRVSGVTIIAPQAEQGAWYTMFTGIDPDFRRRGVAKALKTASFAVARRAGATSVLTHNHEANESVLKLNQSLGLRPALGY